MLRLPVLVLLPCAAMLLLSPVAVAQTHSDPVAATTAVPPMIYESPFARYRTYVDQDVAPWRESNDTAGWIGGWRVYAREAQEPQPAEGAVERSAVPPNAKDLVKQKPEPSAGHGMH